MIPEAIANAGDAAAHRFFKFFIANIRNSNTRRAYCWVPLASFAWTQSRELPLGSIRLPHVAAYVEEQLAKG